MTRPPSKSTRPFYMLGHLLWDPESDPEIQTTISMADQTAPLDYWIPAGRDAWLRPDPRGALAVQRTRASDNRPIWIVAIDGVLLSEGGQTCLFLTPGAARKAADATAALVVMVPPPAPAPAPAEGAHHRLTNLAQRVAHLAPRALHPFAPIYHRGDHPAAHLAAQCALADAASPLAELLTAITDLYTERHRYDHERTPPDGCQIVDAALAAVCNDAVITVVKATLDGIARREARHEARAP